ncbi:unnamed protein product, partial [Ixodes hexagonus]
RRLPPSPPPPRSSTQVPPPLRIAKSPPSWDSPLPAVPRSQTVREAPRGPQALPGPRNGVSLVPGPVPRAPRTRCHRTLQRTPKTRDDDVVLFFAVPVNVSLPALSASWT